ncbi:hypothetical protein MtrunA17_Chr4g0035221 [Medicago truncatula]|uniref:DUF241 domain protein n=1 Tax=Medicago truncatula TaxID=3880 RepID=G7JHD8_MEDTR|nr:uncharacterized protein LOC11407676 [Medicago truncatula]AES89148.1 DUF241 domain protein [Medicago truncatula]RHN61308.1 hypothetical protein MtrunA17_Chr4g0035221 [Medicago truncatula]
MAVNETNIKSSLHIRSNSLPSTPHPLISYFENNLQILKSYEGDSSVSSSSVCNNLNGMQDLHDCIDKFLQMPIEQQALSQECNEKCVDDLLESSLRILDICSTTKDCLSLSKENIQELQSVIRRKRGVETGLAVEGVKYLALRKTTKKQIQKAFLKLKEMKEELIASSLNKKDNNSSPMLGFLKKAEEVTVSSLEHLLLFISNPKGHSNNKRWSAISKLMHSKRVVCDSQYSDTNEFEKVDATLLSLISHNPSSTENFQSHLEDLEMCIQDLEIGVEQISRKLIRNRVSLLNIFNH